MGELPEAGGVAWTELWGKKTEEDGVVHDVKINLTSRANTPLQALVDLLAALKTAREEYKLTPYQVRSKPPEDSRTPVKTPFEASTSVSTPLPAPTVSTISNEPVYEDIEQGEGVIYAVKMSVTPREDGKSKLDFFENGHKYPDVSAVMRPENLVELLQNTGAWTVGHLTKPSTYDVKYEIRWRNSATLNKNGKPYKNIVSVAREQ